MNNNLKEEGDDIDIYQSSTFNELVVQFSPGFRVDNEKIIDTLKTNLINTPEYTQINTCINSKHGRDTYLTLVASNKCEDFTEQTIGTVFAQLNSVFYRGETRLFTSETYANICLEAHRLLKQA